jgi:Ca-activated chloride channel family protein
VKIKLTILFFLVAGLSNAQTPAKKLTRLLFIFDFSNSMNGTWETSTRIAIAKKLMLNSVDSLKNVPDVEIALRLYGHQTPLRPDYQDCKDSKLEVPFSKGNYEEIKSKIKYNYPKGTTPIAYSLEQAGADFPECKDCNNVIVLITDGIEACDGDPCAIAKALRSKGVSVRPFVIGVGLDLSYLNQLECIGTVFDASNENSFKNTLKVVIDQAVNNTTVQLNLNDINGKPTETNVAFSIYDQKTGKERYNYVHTINKFGYPDTLSLDAVSTYKIVVHTIPQVVKENIVLKPGIHNVIEVNTPQGSLDLKIKSNSKYLSNIPAIVRKKGEMNTLHVQYIGQTEKYLVGKYDIEILTLPRIYISNIEIKQSTIYPIEILNPGVFKLGTINPGYGSIMLLEDGKQKFVCNINSELKSQEFALQPGKYKIIYRTKKSKKTIYTIDKNFTITSTQTTTLNL